MGPHLLGRVVSMTRVANDKRQESIGVNGIHVSRDYVSIQADTRTRRKMRVFFFFSQAFPLLQRLYMVLGIFGTCDFLKNRRYLGE